MSCTLATAIVASNRTTVERAICNAFIRSVTRAILIDKCITFVRTHHLCQDLLQCHRLSHRWNFHHFHQPIWTVIEAFVSSNRITVERAICNAFSSAFVRPVTRAIIVAKYITFARAYFNAISTSKYFTFVRPVTRTINITLNISYFSTINGTFSQQSNFSTFIISKYFSKFTSQCSAIGKSQCIAFDESKHHIT